MVLGGGWPLGNQGFLTRAWGPGKRGPRRGSPARELGSRLRLPQRPRSRAVPTCSRRFCQRPHGLSSRMSLSSSLSSSRSRSRSRSLPRLGAGSGAAMARRAQTAALRAIRRCRCRRRRSLHDRAPRKEAQRVGEPPPPPAPTRAPRIRRRGRAAGVGGARPPLRSRLLGREPERSFPAETLAGAAPCRDPACSHLWLRPAIPHRSSPHPLAPPTLAKAPPHRGSAPA